LTRSTKRFAINAISNWANQGVQILVGVFMVPYVIIHLGKEQYGFFQMAISFIAMLGVLDLGISGSLIRFFSKGFAENDKKAISSIYTISGIILGSVGLLGGAGVVAAYPWFREYYNVPEPLVWQVGGLMACMGLSFFLRFLCNVPRWVILGANKFVWVNGVGIASTLVRFGGVVAMFELAEPCLFYLGISILIPQLLRVVCFNLLAKRLNRPQPLFVLSGWDSKTAKSLFGFSVINLVCALGASAVINGPVFLIGKYLSMEMVTAFSPALLICNMIVLVGAGLCSPLTPLASKDIAASGGKSIGHWMSRLGRLTMVLVLGFVLPLFIFGEELFRMWLGESFVWVLPFTLVLVCSTAMATAQTSVYFLAMGEGRIKPQAYSAFVMAVASLAGVWAGLKWFDWTLWEIAWCLLIFRVLRNLVYVTWVYCRHWRVSIRLYLLNVYAKPILAVLVVVALGMGLRALLPSTALWLMALEMGALWCVYAALVFFGVLGREDRVLIQHRVFGRMRRKRETVDPEEGASE
jgi:O-antigen/teichoic acid export membrane protein